MTDGMRQHWLVDVARRVGLEGAQQLDVPAATPIRDAWSTVARRCHVPEAELALRVAQRFGLAAADLEVIEPGAVKLVPESLARRYGVLPVRETDRELFVATASPLDMEAEQALGFASSRAPVFLVAPPVMILDALDQVYSPDRVVEALLGTVDASVADAVQLVEDIAPESMQPAELTTKPVVMLTNLILQEAVRERASDIHIEPGRLGGSVRMRIDGVLRNQMQLPMAALNRVISRIKILGKLDIADRLRPQDGRARIKVHGKSYDLRISTVPTRESEKAVIRVLDPEGSPTLNGIGFADEELRQLHHLVGFREGIVLVTGPTGSGKTTTLYAIIRELAAGAVNVMTVEDPVEYEIPIITQIQVDPKRDVTFASALRAILRQDPDVVFVGEIRDLETADTAVQAAMTGHLVLASLHTNDAAGVVARLTDIGLSPVSVASALRGVVAQRLLRRLCEECREPIAGALTPHEAELSARFGVRPTVRAIGCVKCNNTGYRGRIAVAEVLTSTAEVADAVARNLGAAEVQKRAVAAGMRPISEVALGYVRDEVTTLDEVERVIGEASAAPAEAAAEAAAAPGLPHVLIVDDDAVVRSLAGTLLEKAGMRVSEAVDGRAGLEALQAAGDVALMVLDLDLPEILGIDVLRQVRANVATAGLPVLVLTGTEEHGDEIEVMDAGADDYVRKPRDPARFIARVKAVLRRAGI